MGYVCMNSNSKSIYSFQNNTHLVIYIKRRLQKDTIVSLIRSHLYICKTRWNIMKLAYSDVLNPMQEMYKAREKCGVRILGYIQRVFTDNKWLFDIVSTEQQAFL